MACGLSLVGCSFCLDLGYFQAHNEKLDVDKAREVPRWRESDAFTPLERDVLDYAEAMVERAVFVLREVFDLPYDEIAEAVGKSAAAVRQIAHRAREHVTARRPRLSVSRSEQQAAVERFQAAVTTGDLQGLLDVLAPDVVFMADGGGVVPAAIRPLSGAKTVARQLSRFPVIAPGARIVTSWLNGAPALRIDPGGEFDSAVSLTVDRAKITRIYVIRNPHKLAGLDRVTVLAR